MNSMRSFPAFALADGTTFLLHATDPEAEEAVQRLAGLMSLGTAATGRKIYITVAGADSSKIHRQVSLPDKNEVPVCIIPSAENRMVMEVIQMEAIAGRMALLTLPDGGALLHGALACIDGRGVILAAPGGTGKTTASNRFPPPWRSLSDDSTLVVRDRNGNYFAHPWPTWSQLFNGDTGCRWAAGEYVPLRAIFFLCQSEEDFAEPLDHDTALAFLMESSNQVCGMRFRNFLPAGDSEPFTLMQFSAISDIVKTVPMYRLRISLSGQFWDVISGTLKLQDDRQWVRSPVRRVDAGTQERKHSPAVDNGHILVVTSGSSMLPTLRQPDLLEIAPYGSDQPGPSIGDVICFFSPEKKYRVIHRVISISGNGIITRGDNNPTADEGLLSREEIIGKVVFAWRGGMRRTIAGGLWGLLIHRTLRARKMMLRLFAPAVRTARPLVKITRDLASCFPALTRQRVVLYATRHRRILRLFIWGKNVGEFDERRKIWTIHFPYTILVDSGRLPMVEPVNPDFYRRFAETKER